MNALHRRTPWAALLAAAVVAGCATGPEGTEPPPAPQGSEADRRAALPAALMAEQQWLQQWFGGTPVSIVNERGGALRVDVPDEFAFAAGQATVRPPLAAVLDRVAESMRRRDMLVLTVTPPETGNAALAKRRADAVIKHLSGRGVDAARMRPAAASGAVVGLRLLADPASGA